MRKFALWLLCCSPILSFANTPYFSYCFNSGSGVSYGFTSCIDRNFNVAERAFDRTLYLRYCANYSNDWLDYGFVSCINQNFDSISTKLRETGHNTFFFYCMRGTNSGVDYGFQSCVNNNFSSLSRQFPL
ncbi:MAG: hypothetical protein HN353_05485 [Bdellovibrionales bacterium]|jgi:hypothetical protein|nr:hypothetical protein [Bdellovibrionales bacterium]MBT3525106.1 hypothetical protein [Bdellovibrionales bacterium]MBT7669877.1 hypothetical protein [Bdellovibrionales bacterium]